MPIIEQFVRFAGVGVIGTAAHYSVLTLLASVLGVHPVSASALGFIVGAIVNYWLNRKLTFASTIRQIDGLFKFLVVASIGLLLNTAIVAVLIDHAGLHYLVAQIIATGLVLGWNFVGNRYWTFRDCLQ